MSYVQATRAWAEWIAWVLEEADYWVLIQAWDFVPGTNWIQGMQEGTSEAESTIAILSADYHESVYGGAEWQAAYEGIDRKLLTVRVSKCDPAYGGRDGPVRPSRARPQTRLVGTDKAAVAGRAKPPKRPGFPGAGRAVPSELRFPASLPAVWRGAETI